ncbi:hypothetical protein Tco_0446542 [Tanacetum coccineum]
MKSTKLGRILPPINSIRSVYKEIERKYEVDLGGLELRLTISPNVEVFFDYPNVDVLDGGYLGLTLPPLKIAVITEYLVNIRKRRAFWSLNEDILKINDSDYQYAVSIKEDTAYPCLHSPKTTKERMSIRRILRRPIRRIGYMACEYSGRYQTASRFDDSYGKKGKKFKIGWETFAPNDKADYYFGITSITVNGKNAYELKGKFLDDLHNNAFSGTNGKDAVEHIEYYLKIIDPIKSNVDLIN